MTTTTTRKQVSDALLALLGTAADFKTKSKRFKSFDDVASVQKPALFLVKHQEEHQKQKLITPAVRGLLYEAYVFIATGRDPNTTPMDDLDAIVDAIDPVSGGVLRPGPNARQTLGNLVTDCFVDGRMVTVPGDFDGLGVAIIPIRVVFMQP